MDEDPGTAQWRAMLTGEDPSIANVRRFWRRLPAAPRCKVCASPFHGIGGVLAKVTWHGAIPDNPLLCRACFGQLSKHAGGAEIDIGVVFADVRGSTALAERISAAAFRSLLQDYYRSAANAIDEHGGIVDKFLGDGVMALFIPVIAGEQHAERAITAGQAILEAMERDGLTARGLQVGAGVHAGPAFVGVVGRAETTDFSAVGDTVNVAARLGGVATGGELVVSHAAWLAAGRPEPADVREIPIAGRTEGLAVVSLRVSAAASPAA